MKQITISVPDGQFAFFMQLVKALNFVQIEDQETLENSLTPPQRETWENVKAGFEEYKLTEAGKRPTRPIEALLDELNG
ncbi:hypothetical protein [Salmonirosea aquatica]|uniref:Uncharacterized protein n=1 Tax=Salmonirosea aquatica TaxID=2654236 RepID=A0A7C9BFY5_9BACT|nr:hypothetical protein [Cytophagaceae bacterium SJW1-29]